jgi:membrane-associated HD superfamily phosphohydrolase
MSNALNDPTDPDSLRPWERKLFWYVLAGTMTLQAAAAPFYLPWWASSLVILAAVCTVLMALVVRFGSEFFRSIFEEYEDLYKE